MAHMFFVQAEQIRKIEEVALNRIDGQYFVIQESNGWCDIAQWSDKYQNLKILVCKRDSLDERKRLW